MTRGLGPRKAHTLAYLKPAQPLVSPKFGSTKFSRRQVRQSSEGGSFEVQSFNSFPLVSVDISLHSASVLVSLPCLSSPPFSVPLSLSEFLLFRVFLFFFRFLNSLSHSLSSLCLSLSLSLYIPRKWETKVKKHKSKETLSCSRLTAGFASEKETNIQEAFLRESQPQVARTLTS